MTVSMELIFSLGIQLISIGIVIGIYRTTINFMQDQIKELKEDMKKYNSVLERLAIAENSIKSAHNRIDELIDENRHN